MLSRLQTLYNQYTQRHITTDEMEELKSLVDNISDDDLWKLMVENSDDDNFSTMTSDVKFGIEKKLRKMIIRRRIYTFTKYIAAASIIICIYLGSNSLYKPDDTDRYLTSAVKSGSKTELTLPDGSRVQLNSASSITFDLSNKNSRTVYLNGEAFFDVAKDPKLPFRVMVGEMMVEVYGTSFNVNAYDVNHVETALVSGKVFITAPKLHTQQYSLSPGEMAVYNHNDSTISISHADIHLATGWLDEYLIFESEPLSQVIKKIERWYGMDVELRRKDIADDVLTGSFRHENIHNVLYSLSLQYNFNYELEKDHIIIY